jgi:hypothetical protein
MSAPATELRQAIAELRLQITQTVWFGVFLLAVMALTEWMPQIQVATTTHAS